MTAPLDVVCIGNAIVDVIAHADDAFLAEHRLVKGAMTLIDAAEADALYARMGPGIEMSGGSAGNTAAGIAMLGGRAAYIGKVRNDQLGGVFRHDIRAVGVTFDTAPAQAGPPTARSLILVTPDAQRSMHTFLGACAGLTVADVDARLVEAAAVTYVEGYLWDSGPMQAAVLKAAAAAHAAGRRFSLTLSDSFWVERHRASFKDLVDGPIDILFGNQQEVMSLYQVATLEDALAAVRGRCQIAVVTRSEHGSIVLAGEETIEVAAEPVARLVDTTGAGDLYAAGFLFGLTAGRGLAECGLLGSIAAAEVIGHFGARPEADLSALAAARLGGAATAPTRPR